MLTFQKKKRRRTANLLALLPLCLFYFIASCGGSDDPEPTAKKEEATSVAREGFQAIGGTVDLTSAGSSGSNALSLVEEETGACSMYCWILNPPAEETSNDSQAQGSDGATAADGVRQVDCFCNPDTDEYYCEIPKPPEGGEPYQFECAHAPQGVIDCAVAYKVAEQEVPLLEMGKHDLTHDPLTCKDGYGVATSDDFTSEKLPESFVEAVKVGLPDDTTLSELTNILGYDARMVSRYDGARQDQQSGCYTGNCGGGEAFNLGLVDNGGCFTDHNGQEICGGDSFKNEDGQDININVDDNYNHNPDYQGPPPVDFGGGNQGDRLGQGFNPIICDKAGYSVPEHFYEEFMANNYQKLNEDISFERSGAHFNFDLVDESTCTADSEEDCQVNVTVQIEDNDGLEEVIEFSQIPLTGFENTFLIKGESNLSDEEIKTRALKEWAREFLGQRNDFFTPPDLPHPDNFCEPINLANGIRQYYGYDALESSDNAAYTTVFPNSDFGSHYGWDPFKDEQTLCSDVVKEDGDVEESTLTTLADFCLKEDGTARDADDFLEDYADYFAPSDDDDDAILFSGADFLRNGLLDHYDWLGENNCFDDDDSDGVNNFYDTDPENSTVTTVLTSFNMDNNNDHPYQWCQDDLLNRIENPSQWDPEISSDLYSIDSDDNYTLVDTDDDSIPDFIDSCLDGSGFFDSKNDQDESDIGCTASEADDVLKNAAHIAAQSLCDAYDDKLQIDYWNNKVEDASGDDIGWCRPHGENSDEVGTCGSFTTDDTCNSGGCWWDSDSSFQEDITLLRLVGIELNVGQWAEEWNITQLFPLDSYDHESSDAPQPHKWRQAHLSEADDIIAESKEDERKWGSQELERISNDVSDCRQRFSGNSKELRRRTNYVSGILSSVERLAKIENTDGSKKYICEQADFNETACLSEKAQAYDESRAIKCFGDKMSQCQFTNLQAVLKKANVRLAEWADAQGAINDTYEHLEDAVKLASDDECLPDSLTDPSENSSDDDSLAEQLTLFATAYATDLQSAVKKAFNHLGCMAISSDVAKANELCMVAPSYGKPDAYSEEALEDLFLTAKAQQEENLSLASNHPPGPNGPGEDCKEDEIRNHTGGCEKEIICPLPPGVTNAQRTQCLDDIISQATISSGCGTEFITEKFALIGSRSKNDVWNDGIYVREGEILTKFVKMTSHTEGVDKLLDDCRITVTVAKYDANGCWEYVTADGTTVAELKDTCVDDNGDAIVGCKKRSDYLDATWVKATRQEVVDMRKIVDRQVIKMVLEKTGLEESAKDLATEFEHELDKQISSFEG